MQILVLGGARLVGRHIVEALVAGGHEVTMLSRGQTQADLPAAVERLLGDRNDGVAGLSALAGRSWDACVDVSGYTPRQVRASAEFLKGRVGRYVFISTVSVYAEQNRHPILETDPLLPPAAEDVTEVTGETYGPLKVTCEAIVQEVYEDACTILRPQLVTGPHDYTPRYPYWPDRVARGGTILAAGKDDFIQVIDARDIGQFVVKVIQDDIGGLFNLSGPRLTWEEFLTLLDAVDVFWTTPEHLEQVGVNFYELPVYLPANSEQGGIMEVSNERARAAGLTLTAPLKTAQDTREWSKTTDLTYSLTPEREAEILTLLRGRH
ncbi:NAD-dependent epimerase/dehydratase family protein [Deinococcus cavernae]|uniref:UDP-glucose 4-epimerase n=1 Tax=Deinococcus cavernae TaxID=2320857 RepID=A0A418V845_9DEIO|nr:NAD-dependent epimerase/dehydratase family protein [Deinococcus cavernae]RJF72283.1 NAD-dependent epimerase/dehydratase family protein [Deinococcus cavernae]